MPARRRLIPYLEAPISNIVKLSKRMQKRMALGPVATGWINIGDLDDLKNLQSEMLEELIELDGILDKIEKTVDPKDS